MPPWFTIFPTSAIPPPRLTYSYLLLAKLSSYTAIVVYYGTTTDEVQGRRRTFFLQEFRVPRVLPDPLHVHAACCALGNLGEFNSTLVEVQDLDAFDLPTIQPLT